MPGIPSLELYPLNSICPSLLGLSGHHPNLEGMDINVWASEYHFELGYLDSLAAQRTMKGILSEKNK